MQLIALRTVQYNDKHSILSVYTAERGRVSVFVPATKSKEARRTRALLMPFAVVEAEINFRPDKSIYSISDIRPATGVTPLHISADPLRGIIGMFLADFVQALLRESPPDSNLFEFLKYIGALLAEAPDKWLPNFHILTLIKLTNLMGIAPDESTAVKGRVLDMKDGMWRSMPPLHNAWLDQENSRIAATLCKLDWQHITMLNLTPQSRRAILDGIIAYYETHFGSLHLPTLSVLRDL